MSDTEIRDLFGREEDLFEKYALIVSGGLDTENDTAIFAELLKEYRSLLIQSKKLVKISDRVHGKMNSELHSTNELSNTDFLTGLHNRRHYSELLHKEWKGCSRDRIPFSVLMLDIDFFKIYNDTYGHQKGDACIQMIAAQMKKTISRPRDIIARYGGEEFVILLPDTALDGAIALAESIRSSIASVCLEHKGSPVFGIVTISIGVASVIPDEKSTPESLVGKADDALYVAKEKGRNNVKSA